MTPTKAIYGDDTCGQACDRATDTIAGLPITGLDLLLLAGVAVVLVLIGLALRYESGKWY